MTLQTDQPNHDSDVKAARLATAALAVDPGKWHRVVVEVHGPRMIAQIDDAPPISGESPRVDVDKIDFGIPVSGVSAEIKGIKVYSLQ